ncbi:hypothetical protein [Hymenobacter sp. CRA2]|uniref:hypothetical protein n=1 Tax=Hymenobacter sp. CRA2 TaxID=1955620 RepID=UPI0009901004|nr:hypothetical protein [Hymenobacter sp. CRA2]OON69380.1 hypothetical protein B0919_08855 [Hymenobacter sp. CRA2]
MDDAYFLSLGFERWIPPFPLQTAMYVHAHAARDGARLYLSVPHIVSSTGPAPDQSQLLATVEAFFAKHGGRLPEPVPELLGTFY